MMAPKHFSKQNLNPYFHTDHYMNESAEMIWQRKIEKTFKGFVTMPIRVFKFIFKSRRRNKK
jgi:hypothetical protein